MFAIHINSFWLCFEPIIALFFCCKYYLFSPPMPDLEDDPHAGEVTEHETKVSNKTVDLCYVCHC